MLLLGKYNFSSIGRQVFVPHVLDMVEVYFMLIGFRKDDETTSDSLYQEADGAIIYWLRYNLRTFMQLTSDQTFGSLCNFGCSEWLSKFDLGSFSSTIITKSFFAIVNCHLNFKFSFELDRNFYTYNQTFWPHWSWTSRKKIAVCDYVCRKTVICVK